MDEQEKQSEEQPVEEQIQPQEQEETPAETSQAESTLEKKDFELVPIQPTVIKDTDSYNLENADYEMLVQMGIDVSEAKTYAQWVLGKLAATVVGKYGDLKKYCQDIRQKYEVVQQYMNTYRKFIAEDPDFSPEKYAGSVPWGVLALAANKSNTPQKVVDELQNAGQDATMEGAYRKIMTDKHGVEVPPKPKIKLNWDINSNKYRLQLNPNDYDLIDWSEVREQLKSYLEGLE